MSRIQDPAEHRVAAQTEKVDAAALARLETAVDRRYMAGELPRLAEAGVGAGSSVTIRFQFSEYEGRPAVTGALRGTVVLACQRCLGEVALTLDEQFRVIVVEQESELAHERGGYEPILAEAHRLDLHWLAEEETLLALPLVPAHEMGACPELGESPAQQEEPGEPDETPSTQRPFANLRDILQKR